MANGKYTIKKAEAVLERLAHGNSIAASMRSISLPRHQYYHWREDHPEFAVAANDAIEQGIDRLEDEAMARASTPDGSDTMLIFMLKTRRREVYGDKWSGEVTGKDGGPIVIMLGEDTRGPQ